MEKFKVTYLMNYTPLREGSKICLHFTTVRALNKKKAKEKMKNINSVILILRVKQIK